jgi:hypothetical protein
MTGLNDGGTPSHSTIVYSFDNLTKRSPFLRLLVDVLRGLYSPSLKDKNVMASIEQL